MNLNSKSLPISFFSQDTVKVAKALLGKIIKHKKEMKQVMHLKKQKDQN